MLGDFGLRVHDLRGDVVVEDRGRFGAVDRPAWNGTGSAVLVRRVGGGQAGADVLEIVDVPSGSRRVVARDADAEPAWSSSGDVIAYVTVDDAVAILNLATGRRIVVRPPKPFGVAWSPDSRFLAIELLDEGLELVDAGGARLLRVPPPARSWPEDGWTWDARSRVTHLADDGIASVDPATGERRVLVRETGRRAITALRWAPDGVQLAFARERLPGFGRDVFLLDASGREHRVTSPFPDGGSSDVEGWLVGPLPALAPQPGTRVAGTRVVARAPAAARIFQGGPRRVYGTLRPQLGETSIAPEGCGTLVFTGAAPFRTCDVVDESVLGAAATATHFAWVAEHVDRGIGDDYGAALYVRPLRAGSRPPRPRPIAGVIVGDYEDGPMTVKAAGHWFVVGRNYDSGYDRFRDDVLTWQAGRLRTLVRAGRGDELRLLDADAGRVLVRSNRNLRLLRPNGTHLAARALGREPVLGAALAGANVVVLRPGAVEQYDARGLRRIARLPLQRQGGGQPVLLGAHGGTAAYLRGLVLHLVRFRDRRQVALRIPGAVPPMSGALTGTGLTIAFQRENSTPAGFVATVDVARALR